MAEDGVTLQPEASGSRQEDARFLAAVSAMKAGDLRQSERLVREVLADTPRDAQATHLLGVIAFQAQNHEAALTLVRQAVALEPLVAAYQNTLGFLLRLARQHEEAIRVLRQAIALRSDYAEAYNNLGIALSESGRLEEAITAYEGALATRGDFPEVLNNLGNALARSNRLEEAIARYDAAIAINPDYADAWSNRADALLSRNKDNLDEALTAYRKSVELNPRGVEVWVKIGTCHHTAARYEEAETAFRQALRINPNHLRALTSIAATLEKRGDMASAAAHLRHALTRVPDDVGALKSLGHITLKLGNSVEAKHVLDRALKLVPADPDALYTYANCLLRMERLQEAMDLYLRVRELQPNQARGTFAPAAVLLMDGQYDKGWAAYESRYAMSAFKPNVPNVRERLWDGGPLNRRRLLVHVEQGFGDTIQFCRYLPLIKERFGADAKVIFLCEPELHRVLGTLDGVDEVHHLRQRDVQIVYDVQIPLLSLPHRFGTVLETVPRTIPYLSVPAEAARKKKLPQSKGALIKAGIVWTGRPSHSDNLYRSIPMKLLAPLFDINGVDFHSLQVGNGVDELDPHLSRGNVFDHAGEIKDFADTAAIIAELDVLVTVDTAVCHLAGAMGRDVWTMIPFGGEWRWLRNREDTPWYPSMRLVRQRILGDWGQVIDRVRDGLEGAVRTRRDIQNALPAKSPAPAKKPSGRRKKS